MLRSRTLPDCYTRYAGDIFIIYEHKATTHTQILYFANSVHGKLKLNLTQEIDARLSFRDLLIYRTTKGFEIDIYGKAASSDTVIHFTPNHTIENKTAAFDFSCPEYISKL